MLSQSLADRLAAILVGIAVISFIVALSSCTPAPVDVRDAIGRQPPNASGEAADGTKTYFWKTRDCDLAASTDHNRKVTAVTASGNCDALRKRLGI